MANLLLPKDATSQALSDTWHAMLGVARDFASTTTQGLDALAQELVPQVVQLTNEAAAGSASAQRALNEAEGIVVATAAKIGLQGMEASGQALAAGIQAASKWLLVLAKAAIIP